MSVNGIGWSGNKPAQAPAEPSRVIQLNFTDRSVESVVVFFYEWLGSNGVKAQIGQVILQGSENFKLVISGQHYGGVTFKILGFNREIVFVKGIEGTVHDLASQDVLSI